MQFLVSLSLILPALAAPIASPQSLDDLTGGGAAPGGDVVTGLIGSVLGGGKLAIRNGAAPSHGSEEDKDTLSVDVNAKVAARSPPNVVPIQIRNAHGGPPGQKHKQEKGNDEGLITIVVDALSRRAEHGNPHGGHESDKEEEESGLVVIDAKADALTARELLKIDAKVKADVDVNANVGANVDVGGEDEEKPSHAPSHGPSHGSGYGGHAQTRRADAKQLAARSADPETEVNCQVGGEEIVQCVA